MEQKYTMQVGTPTESLIDLANGLVSGRISIWDEIAAVEEKCNALEPLLHTLVPESQRFERLREQARILQEQYPNAHDRPPLFGVLVGIKDVFYIDGMPTRAGSKLDPAVLKRPQGELVSNLLRVGALILGKTATTEFAYFAPSPTHNPHQLEHTPGGSSSGSAAAVAAGLLSLAVGTQTIGSIIRPAAFCGVVGFKPTFNRLPTSGLLYLAPSLDHAGLFTRDASDMQFAARVLISDWRKRAHSPKPILGVPTGPYLDNVSPQGLDHFGGVIQTLSAKGWEIRQAPAMEDYVEIVARNRLVVAAEAAATHQDWYSDYAELYHGKTSELIEKGRTVSASELDEARKGQSKLRREMTEWMEQQGVDLLLAPSAVGPAPEGLDSTGDPIMSLPWSYTGMPEITVPTGKSDKGLPMGTQLIGRWNEDEFLLEWTIQVENDLKNH